jgi:Flp pilus assembly secretin CpaC
MRRHLALTFAAISACQSFAPGEESAYAMAPTTSELHGPQLPAVADESRNVVRLASALKSAPASSSDQVAALQSKLAERDRLQSEIDELRKATGTPEQILVRVEILEVSLTKLKQLGIELPESAGGIVARPESLAALRRPAAYRHSSEPSVADVPADGTSAELVGLLKQNNIGKVLADPSLVVLSDRPASFVVGGQVPVPAAPGSKLALEFQEFGTRVDVRATSLGNNRLRLEVTPRVSEIDESHAIEVQGQRVPGFRVRQCAAGFEAALWQTVIIAGGSQDRVEAIRTSDGRIEERHNEIVTWYVVRTEAVDLIEPLIR